MLTSTALVLMMTIPGLALFYGGMVRKKNVLATVGQAFGATCIITVLWMVIGYSIAFTTNDSESLNKWIGGFKYFMLKPMGIDAINPLAGTIPESVYMCFQMTFAIITPALIAGSLADRMKFSSFMVFMGAWLVLVYSPIAHWVWGGGWLAAMGVRDFAGGLVVHTTAGTSALVAALVIGARTGFPREIMAPHNPGYVMMGASMLWVGWFGFNAGSALTSDGSAAMAMTVTHISAATASLVWMSIEWSKYGRPSLVGIVTGMVAGLATITPASGFVGPVGALVIGAAAGFICYFATQAVKQSFKIDDSLDVFAVHGVGGVLGTLLTAVFADPGLGGRGYAEGSSMGGSLWAQAIGVVATAVWSVVLTWIILKVVGGLVGLRVPEDQETEGLDVTTHGERGYNW
jgi:Amt family ammonium transporter